MDVKVVKASLDLYWYDDHIGKYFEVQETDESSDFDLVVVTGEHRGCYLKSEDVEIQ